MRINTELAGTPGIVFSGMSAILKRSENGTALRRLENGRERFAGGKNGNSGFSGKTVIPDDPHAFDAD